MFVPFDWLLNLNLLTMLLYLRVITVFGSIIIQLQAFFEIYTIQTTTKIYGCLYKILCRHLEAIS